MINQSGKRLKKEKYENAGSNKSITGRMKMENKEDKEHEKKESRKEKRLGKI